MTYSVFLEKASLSICMQFFNHKSKSTSTVTGTRAANWDHPGCGIPVSCFVFLRRWRHV